MKKTILPICMSTVLITASCQNNITATSNSTSNSTNKINTVVTKTDNVAIPTKVSAVSSILPLTFDTFPQGTVSQDANEKSKVSEYLKKNDIFASIPYKIPEKYKTDFSGDGTPVFDLRKGFSGDGTPVFGIKNDTASTPAPYLWNRKAEETILDYLQLNTTVQRTWGITEYATYSQLIEHTISVSGAINNTKKVRLVKGVSFGLIKDNDNYKLHSISPLTIARIEPRSSKYQLRSVTFSSDKNKVIVYGAGKLIPLPGISVNKHIGNNKFKVFVEVVFSQLERPKDFAVVLGFQDKQYQMSNYMGNIYYADIEADKISSSTGLAVELIDRDSLEKNDDYQGNTWIVPIVD